MKHRGMIGLCMVIFLAILFAGCGSSGGGTSGSGSGTMTVGMVDTPFMLSGQTVSAVNLGINKVEAIGTNGKIVIDSFSPPDVVNILNFTTMSNMLTFPSASIPVGTYNQLRLLLDTATTTITVNGTTSQLIVPSATSEGFSGNSQTSTDAGDGQGTAGVKVNLDPHLTVVSGGIYAFTLDFNAQQSIVEANGQFMMKPVIVAVATNIAGSITGTVENQTSGAVANAEVEAEQNGTVVNTGVTDSNGSFTINALPAGTYTLVVENQYTTSAGLSVTATGFDASVGATLNVSGNVTVTAGQTTNVGIITD